MSCFCVNTFIYVINGLYMCVCICVYWEFVCLSLAGGVTAVGTERVHCPSGEKDWRDVYYEESVQQDKTHGWKWHTPTQTRASYTRPLHKKPQSRKTQTKRRGNNWAEWYKLTLSLSHTHLNTLVYIPILKKAKGYKLWDACLWKMYWHAVRKALLNEARFPQQVMIM